MLAIARALSAAGDHVHVVALNPAKLRIEPEPAAIEPATLEPIDINTSARLRPLMRAATSDLPLLVARFYSPRLDRRLRALIAGERFDIIHVESIFMLPYLHTIREVTKAPVVLRTQNTEHVIWQQLAADASRIRKLALSRIAASLKRFESEALSRVDAVVPISDDDAHAARDLGCRVPIHVLPGGLDVRRYSIDRSAEDPRAVYFLGSLNYLPNQQAVRWIAAELWPPLHAALPNVKVTIAGSAAPPALAATIRAAGIELREDVPDATAFARTRSIMIAPLFSGGGMRIKILEAMALGKTVIATPLAAEGLGAINGEDILITPDAQGFIAAIRRCVDDPLFARSIGDRGRSLVANNYDQNVLVRGLRAFYESLIARNARA